MKLSVNELKFSTGLWTRNRTAIQQFLDFKFFFGVEKFPCLTKNVPLAASKLYPCSDPHSQKLRHHFLVRLERQKTPISNSRITLLELKRRIRSYPDLENHTRC